MLAPILLASSLGYTLTSAPVAATHAPRAPHYLQAPQSHVWVYFQDTRAQPGSAADTVLTQKALERRALRRSLPGLFDVRDVALPAAMPSAVESTGAQVRQQSRWMCAVSASATPAQVKALAALPGVVKVEPVRGGRPAWMDEPDPTPGQSSLMGSDYGASQDQLDQIELIKLHSRGFKGEGMMVGILDTGFRRVHEAFFSEAHPLQVVAEYDFIDDDANTDIEEGDDSQQHRHGTWVLGCFAAYLPGTLVGGAYEASFVLCKTEDVTSETPIEEDNYVAALEFIEQNGCDVATSSLSYFDWYTQADFDGVTAVTTIAVNQATANGLVCLTAAGNSAHDSNPSTSTLGAPADAFQVITLGAVDVTDEIAGFSSSGPTADGRIKPELLACGVNAATVNSTNPTGVSGVSGTSFSTPITAAAVTCLLQARPDYTVDELRTALFATASRSDQNGVHPDPLFVEGYGIVNIDAAATHGLSAADFNLDGQVDGADLGTLLGQWGLAGEQLADLNDSGLVDGADLGLLLGQWGT